MRKLVVVCLAVCLASCGKSKQACRAEAEALGQLLRDADTSRGVATEHAKLVVRTDLPLAPDDRGTVVELWPGGAWTWGSDRPGEPIAAILERVREQAARYGRAGEAPPAVQLAIDAATPWQRVVEALDTIAAHGDPRVLIVFARPPSKHTPPPRTSLDRELDAILLEEPAERATRLAERISKLVEDCAAVKQLFASVAGDDGTSKEEYFITGLPPALIACECKCDVPALASAMWRVMANAHPTTTLALSLGEPNALLELPAATPWQEASARLTPGTRGIRARVAVAE